MHTKVNVEEHRRESIPLNRTKISILRCLRWIVTSSSPRYHTDIGNVGATMTRHGQLL